MNVSATPTLVSVVRESGRQFASRPALWRSPDQGSQGLTYARLWEHVERGAWALRQSGIEAADRVALHTEPSPQWVATFFAILHAGGIVVPVLLGTPAATLRAIAAHAGCVAVICSERTRSCAVSAGLDDLRAISIDTLFDSGPAGAALPPRPPAELAVLAFTSGSTRQPLAVELTHANLLADLGALLQVRRAGPEDVFLSMLPPAHLFELMGGLLGPLACGAKIVFPGSLLPNRLIDCLRLDHVTHACCVPALLQCLYDEVMDELIGCGLVESSRRGQSVTETARRFESDIDLATREKIVRGVRARIGSTLRTLVLGGAALDPAWVRLLEALEIRIEVGYGLTEASPIVSLGLGNECPAGSVGRPLPGIELRIDSTGEILLRGPTIARGYYGNPKATRDAFVEGWLRTGDRGHVDAAGYLFITGRSKEAMVTAAGDTLYPEEVEPYYASPLFAEWCVAGRPGPHGNDVPALFVVAARPETSDAELDREFRQLRASAPARFRVEHMIRLEEPLPKTALGKPRRRALVAAFDEPGRSPGPSSVPSCDSGSGTGVGGKLITEVRHA